MTTFAAETVNFMSATQKAVSGATLKAAQNIRKIAGLSVSLSTDFILKRVKFLANDNNKLAQFVKTTGETLGKNSLPSNHGFEKYFAELKNLGIAESKIQEIVQHAYNAAVKEKKLHATFSELGTMVQCAKGIMKEIAQLDPNKISHIMAEKHAWSKVVKDPSN